MEARGCTTPSVDSYQALVAFGTAWKFLPISSALSCETRHRARLCRSRAGTTVIAVPRIIPQTHAWPPPFVTRVSRSRVRWWGAASAAVASLSAAYELWRCSTILRTLPMRRPLATFAWTCDRTDWAFCTAPSLRNGAFHLPPPSPALTLPFLLPHPLPRFLCLSLLSHCFLRYLSSLPA